MEIVSKHSFDLYALLCMHRIETRMPTKKKYYKIHSSDFFASSLAFFLSFSLSLVISLTSSLSPSPSHSLSNANVVKLLLQSHLLKFAIFVCGVVYISFNIAFVYKSIISNIHAFVTLCK